MLELKVNRGSEVVVLRFEHSLLSVSKWESKHRKPFLSLGQKPADEMIDYYQCMLVSPEDEPEIVYRLAPSQMDEIVRYINNPMTASTAPSDPDQKKSSEVITSEIIYYQMTALKINWEAQSWHLNRLMMLIAITSYRQQPPKKESKAGAMARWQEMNRRNRERLNSKG